jgi:hypothetical protein
LLSENPEQYRDARWLDPASAVQQPNNFNAPRAVCMAAVL